MKPHKCPTDISTEEIILKLGEHPTREQIEDYLFENLNDDFSLIDQDWRKKAVEWYYDKLHKF